jgi:hypothetical protein
VDTSWQRPLIYVPFVTSSERTKTVATRAAAVVGLMARIDRSACVIQGDFSPRETAFGGAHLSRIATRVYLPRADLICVYRERSAVYAHLPPSRETKGDRPEELPPKAKKNARRPPEGGRRGGSCALSCHGRFLSLRSICLSICETRQHVHPAAATGSIGSRHPIITLAKRPTTANAIRRRARLSVCINSIWVFGVFDWYGERLVVRYGRSPSWGFRLLESLTPMGGRTGRGFTERLSAAEMFKWPRRPPREID